MENKYISRLDKRDILNLPNFENDRGALIELRALLQNRLTLLGINRKDVRRNDYIEACNLHNIPPPLSTNRKPKCYNYTEVYKAREQKKVDGKLFNELKQKKTYI